MSDWVCSVDGANNSTKRSTTNFRENRHYSLKHVDIGNLYVLWLLKLLLFVVEDAAVEDVVSGEQVAGQAGRVDPSVRENRLGFRTPNMQQVKQSTLRV